MNKTILLFEAVIKYPFLYACCINIINETVIPISINNQTFVTVHYYVYSNYYIPQAAERSDILSFLYGPTCRA